MASVPRFRHPRLLEKPLFWGEPGKAPPWLPALRRDEESLRAGPTLVRQPFGRMLRDLSRSHRRDERSALPCAELVKRATRGHATL